MTARSAMSTDAGATEATETSGSIGASAVNAAWNAALRAAFGVGVAVVSAALVVGEGVAAPVRFAGSS
ncbi:hypothetical protein RCH16_003602 [Cryobacterium sp. MP_M5]|uniref:hypothetical protein n=1 Tax=unclassified Cryobacterium TaxID=2649013 RepID=UPI001A299004|nr:MULTISPECIES: hypothetical protein [unclassified Cryobacterium]MBG6058968.1 hypothetical protein [Cryobacterium sp. MP_M3]MEC5178563.1 hypothetical protein [Cryobacterium sp. MP_M5]